MKKNYYDGGYRILIDGIPCRFPRKPSPHHLAVIRGESNNKRMRALETTRYAETTYTPVAVWEDFDKKNKSRRYKTNQTGDSFFDSFDEAESAAWTAYLSRL
jgi:hypothetical protein